MEKKNKLEREILYYKKRLEDSKKEFVIIDCPRKELSSQLNYWYSLGFRNDSLNIGNPSDKNQILALVKVNNIDDNDAYMYGFHYSDDPDDIEAW